MRGPLPRQASQPRIRRESRPCKDLLRQLAGPAGPLDRRRVQRRGHVHPPVLDHRLADVAFLRARHVDRARLVAASARGDHDPGPDPRARLPRAVVVGRGGGVFLQPAGQPVRGQHDPSFDQLLAAGLAEPQPAAVGGAGERQERRAHPGQERRPGQDRLADQRRVERLARQPGPGRQRHPGHGPAGPELEPREGYCPQRPDQMTEPGPAEHPQGPRVQAPAAHLVAGEAGLIDQQHRGPAAGQFAGGHRPGRPGPDHDRVPHPAGGRGRVQGGLDAHGRLHDSR